MTLPNFFLIGAARCGTDSLNSYLKQHPEIYMAPMKETNWFVFQGSPINYRGPGDQEALAKLWLPDFDSYKMQFSEVSNERAIGEASPWYIYCPEVPSRIAATVPNAKIIAMLRNPVDRAHSSFGLLRKTLREPTDDFLMACEQERDRIADLWEPIWHYLSMGRYYHQIKRYIDVFGRDNVCVLLYDDFENDPIGVMRQFFAFLGISDSFVPDMSRRLNQSFVPKNKSLHRFLMYDNPIKSVAKSLLPPNLRLKVRNALMSANDRTDDLTASQRRKLTAIFRDDIALLEELLDRDLSHWLVPA